MTQHGDRGDLGHELTQELEAFCGKLGDRQRYAGHIAAWPVQAYDETRSDRIAAGHEHDRNGRCGSFRRQCSDVAAGRDDRCGAAADELGSEPGEALVMSVRIAVIDAHALSFGEARLRQAAMEFREEMRRLGPRPAAEETEKRGRRLRPRRACLERRRHAGAEDELPPPHSITSSERGGGLMRS
ncbi:MAG TPA: hypothetical protein VFE80_09050 [Beijerinckiaceae bacterium]|nr:hypothetical protein [Beijerinckiaceae bacterium]